MIGFKENYVVDKKGNRIGVILGIKEYHKILEELEELESIRVFDEVKAVGDEVVGFEQAVAEIEYNN